jgi:hypothetical protein
MVQLTPSLKAFPEVEIHIRCFQLMNSRRVPPPHAGILGGVKFAATESPEVGDAPVYGLRALDARISRSTVPSARSMMTSCLLWRETGCRVRQPVLERLAVAPPRTDAWYSPIRRLHRRIQDSQARFRQLAPFTAAARIFLPARFDAADEEETRHATPSSDGES